MLPWTSGLRSYTHLGCVRQEMVALGRDFKLLLLSTAGQV